ncbi:MAG: nucleotidyltransferase [Deltaproteobacteria bacterium]|jgi:hypothetical protein|nr:nucleotidyltransferase [Deltaproteobacteria bacterium]MBT7715376.1 nucleotidyltransferase [Deltaproteobacteria bacterium]
MPNLQNYFLEFHKKIKLDDFNENQTLRDKRDTLLEDLRKNISEDAPSFENFDQGSYAMNTGTNPKDGNYDIDEGVIFDCFRDDYKDPVELKKMVSDALTCGNRSVRIRRPCVTVEYLKNGEVDYHVDLVIYAKRSGETALDLAKGKEFSDSEKRLWEISDPKGLIDKIRNRFSDKDDNAQMRRCIRYLKRWRDHKLTSGKPFSIALTCAAYHWFQTSKDIFNNKYNDIEALISLMKAIIACFDVTGWLTIELPVEPHDDLNRKMTESQMKTFKEKLEDLKDALIDAQNEDLEDEACKLLKKQFGDEFPVPEKKDTARKVATAGFAPAGASA